jgi:hypothetical protein
VLVAAAAAVVIKVVPCTVVYPEAAVVLLKPEYQG